MCLQLLYVYSIVENFNKVSIQLFLFECCRLLFANKIHLYIYKQGLKDYSLSQKNLEMHLNYISFPGFSLRNSNSKHDFF